MFLIQQSRFFNKLWISCALIVQKLDDLERKNMFSKPNFVSKRIRGLK